MNFISTADDDNYNDDNKMTNIHIVKIAMSPRFVVDLTLFDGYRNHPGRFDDDMSPELDCDVRVLSIPFGLLPFVVAIFPVPPTFAPDARLPGPCVNTTNAYTLAYRFYCALIFIWKLC